MCIDTAKRQKTKENQGQPSGSCVLFVWFLCEETAIRSKTSRQPMIYSLDAAWMRQNLVAFRLLSLRVCLLSDRSFCRE